MENILTRVAGKTYKNQTDKVKRLGSRGIVAKKIVTIAFFIVLLVPVAGNAQALIALILGKKIETDRLKLGLFMAEQTAFILESGSYNPRIGFAIGAYTDIKLDKNGKWSLQNYLVFKSPKGATRLDVSKNALTDNTEILDSSKYLRRDITYFSILPIVRYHFTPSWSLGLGPFVGFRMSSNDTYTIDGMQKGESLSYKMKIKDQTNIVDAGLALDVQYVFYKGKGVQINFQYQQSFTNVYKKSSGLKGENMVFQIGAGIPIVKKSNDVSDGVEAKSTKKGKKKEKQK